MLGELLGLFKSPVTVFTKRSEERNIKKEGIITAVIVLVISLITILTTYLGVVKVLNKTYKSVKDYNNKYSYKEVTTTEFKELKKEAKENLLENIKFTKIFFKTAGITLLTVVVVAGILFIISRMVKSPKDYIEMVAMTNCAFEIYLIGFILNAIFEYIYVPVGIILFISLIIFAIIALANSFRENIEIEDPNKLVIFSGIVLAIVVAILVLIANNYISNMFYGLL